MSDTDKPETETLPGEIEPGAPIGCSLLGGAGIAPMSLLSLTAREGERMFHEKLDRFYDQMGLCPDRARVTSQIVVGFAGNVMIRESS